MLVRLVSKPITANVGFLEPKTPILGRDTDSTYKLCVSAEAAVHK